MSGLLSKTARTLRGYTVFGCLTLALALAVARFATFLVAHGGLSPAGLSAASTGLLPDLIAHPLSVNFANTAVIGAFAGTIAVMALLALVSSSRGERLANEDTGAEHGDDRLATAREMRSFADRKHYCNNVLYSENCRLAMKPHDKRTRAILDGRNLNCITLGISGLGKTYNLVWPDLMQSVGDALKPMPYGVRNIPAHLRQAHAFRAARWAVGQITGRKDESDGDRGPENKAARTLEGKEKKKQGEKRTRKQEAKETREQEGSDGIRGRMAALRESYEAEVGSRGAAAEARKRAIATVTGGYDVFNTDPKGENVLDVGSLYEAAGYQVKVVDTIDFSRGLHFNPFAYIKRHAVDAVAAQDTRVKVSVTGPAAPNPDAGAETVCLSGMAEEGALAPGMSASSSAGTAPLIGSTPDPAMWWAEASYGLETRKWGAGDLPEASLPLSELEAQIDEIDAKIDAAEPREAEKLAARREQIAQARDVAWMREEMGSFTLEGKAVDTDARVQGAGCAMSAEAAAFTYKRSTGTVEVRFKNLSAAPVDAEVAIELDDALVVDDVEVQTNGEIEWPRDKAGNEMARGKVVWHVRGAAPRRFPRHAGKAGAKARGELAADEICVSERLVLHVHVRTEFVPDGIDLTKVVDCLVTNLRGTDAKSNGSEDPFWEDTKRLCFMSLVSMLFERYTPEYCTLPEAMRLLNMALADSGNPEDPSPLDCLMDMWEHGRVLATARDNDGKERYQARGVAYEKADNVAHSRNSSIALHCYHAFTSGAPETVQSVIISCQACLVNLVTEDAKEFLSCDELALDTLGDPDQRQVIFCVTKDTNSPFDFLTALLVYLAIDLAQDKAYKLYGGKLPRHVRFVLDEAANIGKIPILIRALAVVRSRNMSISMYLQSKAQLALVYGEKEAEVIFDNCTTIVYLGAQTEETREEMSKRVGNETVQSRMFQRSFNASSVIVGSATEQIQSNERRVVSASKMGKLEKGYLMLFIFNAPGAIFDHKYRTARHPYYAYINPNDRRELLCPLPVVKERFDYRAYRRRMEGGGRS